LRSIDPSAKRQLAIKIDIDQRGIDLETVIQALLDLRQRLDGASNNVESQGPRLGKTLLNSKKFVVQNQQFRHSSVRTAPGAY